MEEGQILRIQNVLALLVICGVSQSLTLDESIRIALENRNDLAAAGSSLSSSTWNRRKAGLWFRPSVNADLNFTRDYDAQTIEVSGLGSIPIGSEYTSFVGLNVDIPLFNGMNHIEGYNSARANRLTAQGNARSLREQTSLFLVQAFLALTLARSNHASALLQAESCRGQCCEGNGNTWYGHPLY